MKILYLITKGSWGGAQRYVFDLAAASKEAGHEVVVASGTPGELERKLGSAGIRSIALPGLARDISLIQEVRALFALMRVLGRERPDVLHVNSSKAGLIGVLAGRITGVPRIIFTAHGWAFNEDRPVSHRAVFRFLHLFTVALSHRTICVSEAVARDIRTRGNARKLAVIHNGITCGALVSREVSRNALLPHSPAPMWIGMIAELHATKRVDVAIRAFADIAAKHPDAILVVMGEGEERPGLEELIRKEHLEGRVVLKGFIPSAQSYLSAFDVFMLTSRTEAFAYVVLEAGCASLPVIASNVGGVPEIIESGVTGLLTNPSDAKSVSIALETLVTDEKKRTELGRALKHKVEQTYSQSMMVDKTFALYH